MLGVLILLAGAGASTPLLEAKSARSLDAYAACFSREAEHANGAWSYIPNERGGTFTDFGAHAASASYWLQLRDGGSETRFRLFAAGSAAPQSEIVEAAGKCR